ncbi:DUF5412 family protein [Clostridium polynesiense]|uniref:DUF5412 family protein n=1 Tax=Clostridium polynesiense TaxID=1325933 RepID=UPI00058C8EF6|nr:DUF5412 family protein [Clostridium polynesiense]
MKKHKIILLVTIIILTISIGAFYIINRLFYNMSNLPEGEYITESTSPKGTYTVKTYLCNGGATVSYAVRGELIVNSQSSKPKNIYWDYKIGRAEISWEDDDTAIINGHKIDLPKGKYDWRKKK